MGGRMVLFGYESRSVLNVSCVPPRCLTLQASYKCRSSLPAKGLDVVLYVHCNFFSSLLLFPIYLLETKDRAPVSVIGAAVLELSCGNTGHQWHLSVSIMAWEMTYRETSLWMKVSRCNKVIVILLFPFFPLKFRYMPVGVRTSCSHNWIRNGGKNCCWSSSEETVCWVNLADRRALRATSDIRLTVLYISSFWNV
jgi:hypothetical protein